MLVVSVNTQNNALQEIKGKYGKNYLLTRTFRKIF